MFTNNPNLKPGQLVQVNMPIFGTFVGTVDEVAPVVGRDGTHYAAAEYGVTVEVPGGVIMWAFQEDVVILKEEK